MEIARPDRGVDVDAILLKAGYRRLGSGSFSGVYQKPGKPYVLKVFSANDRAFLDFIALVKMHPDNPHFPKFIGKVVSISPNLSAIRMEPLTPYKADADTIHQYMALRDRKSDDPKSYSMMRREDAFEFMEEYPELKKACDLIIDNLLPNHLLDIKNDNLMMRGKTIVLIDPVKDLSADHFGELPYVKQEEPAPKWGPEDDELLRQLGYDV